MDEGTIGNSDADIRPAADSARGRSHSYHPWTPLEGAFRPYVQSPPPPPSATASLQRPNSRRIIVKRPLLTRLTKDITETYKICNPGFKYSEALNPKRFLTSPSVGVQNDGYDNVNSDLILSLNFVLMNGSQQRYIIKDILGQGTFGQVAKCQVSESDNFVAVKIIKNQPAYYQQALVEVSILTMLNTKFDPEDKKHIVRILDYFVYQRHLCITFEMLGSNLYELIRMNSFKGLPLCIIQLFSKQILQALVVMKEAGIIHCDLKPENILISTRLNPAEIKIIDFGSACLEDRTVYSYIQSRYYRSPEVLLGYPYTTAIDMWSFGCIVAELFLGLPLFPGASEFDLLKRMIDTLGEQPPDHMLRVAKNTSKFFKRVGGFHHLEEDEASRRGRSAYQLLTIEEYEVREMKKPVMGKQYFNFVKLEEIVKNYPYRKNLPDEEISNENLKRLALIDFLRGLVEFDPVKRWSPMQAVQHPFVTGEYFTCPYKPPPETPRVHVSQNVMVDHSPGRGHWFAAGLSPQVAKMNKGYMQNNPHYQMAPVSHANSYGSLGSYGSYSDGLGHGGSCGSYGESGLYGYYPSIVGPSGMSVHPRGMSILGDSPDATRWRNSHIPHGNGLGPIPSAGGTGFCPMSLGASPSQFTPPSSQIQVSTGSPGKYSAPSSPARGSGTSIHGSPLGKAATISQMHRRRSLGYTHGASFMQPQEDNSVSQHLQGHSSYAISSSHLHEGNPQGGPVSSPRTLQPVTSNSQSWRLQKGENGDSTGLSLCLHHQDSTPVSHSSKSQATSLSSLEFSDKSEYAMSPPDPGDWDPNYSDDLLLQDESVDMSYLTSGVSGFHISQPSSSFIQTRGVGRYNRGSNRPRAGSSSSSSNQRTTTGVSPYSQATTNMKHEINTAHASRSIGNVPSLSHMVPHVVPQNSPSRFGQLQQQSIQRFPYSHDHSLVGHGQTATSGCSTIGPRSPAHSAITSGMSWGRRDGHPITANPPSSHVRKDYGRIA